MATLVQLFPGDTLTARLGHCGRLVTSQASILAGFPFSLCLLWWLPMHTSPADNSSTWLYASVLFVGGTIISWCVL